MTQRRALWSAIVALFALACIFSYYGTKHFIRPKSAENAPVELHVASWGGDLQQALDESMIQPAAKMAGVRAHTESYSGDYDHLAATIRNNTNQFDVVHVETVFMMQGAAEHLTVPIDWSVVDRNQFVPSATDTNGVGVLSWSLVLAWNENRLPKGVPPPSSWQDFFDLARYPGPRCMRKTPESNLEIALLADGVPPGQVYQGGLDTGRALHKLDSIKKNITWWASGAELEQKLTAGCSLAAAWNGRAQGLRTTNQAPIALTFDGAVTQYDWWVIPANSHHRAEAMKFLAALGAGVGSDKIAQRFGYGPVSKEALDKLPADLRKTIPTAPENLSRGIVFDADWWFRNEKAVTNRWNDWLINP